MKTFSKNQFILLYIYVFIILFFGNSVRGFFNIDLPTESVIGGIHYLALPFLFLLAFQIKGKKIDNSDWLVIASSILIIFIGKVINGSATIINIVNNCFEPILLCSILKVADEKTLRRMRKLLIVFFVVECGVAVYESLTRTVVFAQLDDEQLYGMERWTMRAYSLHGHPLGNGALVSLMCVFFLTCNNLHKNMKLLLLGLGYFALFAFNNRGSVYVLTGIIALYIIYYMYKGKGSFVKKAIIIAALIYLAIYLVGLLSGSSLGTRIFTIGISKNDDSTLGHLAVMNFLDMLDFKGWLIGVPADLIYGSFMRRAQAVAVESSIVLYILTYGVVYTLCYYLYLFHFIYTFKLRKMSKLLLLLMVILTLNTCNLIFGSNPYVILLVLCMFCFNDNVRVDGIFLNISNKKNSFQSITNKNKI